VLDRRVGGDLRAEPGEVQQAVDDLLEALGAAEDLEQERAQRGGLELRRRG
jgi:hypothetical protein